MVDQGMGVGPVTSWGKEKGKVVTSCASISGHTLLHLVMPGHKRSGEVM